MIGVTARVGRAIHGILQKMAPQVSYDVGVVSRFLLSCEQVSFPCKQVSYDVVVLDTSLLSCEQFSFVI